MNNSFIVADIGNSSIHLGEFQRHADVDLWPAPTRTFNTSCKSPDFDAVEAWLGETTVRNADLAWCIGSVNRGALNKLSDWLNTRREPSRVVTYRDIPMPIVVKQPETIGIDRLASAFAANELRPPHHTAIIVDSGSAITIDCVSAAGQFVGGIIAPGLELSFQSLNQNTDLLPLTKLGPSPGLIGDSTMQALQSGVYWMTISGIEGMIAKLRTELASPCTVFVTGGSMPAILPNLNLTVQHLPHLVLSGLALTNR